MPLEIRDGSDGVLRAHFGECEILAYSYLNAAVDKVEVPKPYFHPLRTLGGSVVTLCRPNDHPWHKGIGMTLTRVGAANFWGGRTYTRGAGYAWIENYGRQRHVRWLAMDHAGNEASWKHEVGWEDLAGRTLLRETRAIALKVSAEDSFWTLDFETEMTNATAGPLSIGTHESSEGLTGSFYTGLFWRLPREFLDHINTIDDDVRGAAFCDGCKKDDENMHGMPARWVALHGSVDGSVEPVTVAMIDRSPAGMSAPRVFLRRNQVGIALPFQGPKDRTLVPGDRLKLSYRMLMADGHWREDRLRSFCAEGAVDERNGRHHIP